mmetsp:Transcript_40667/g.85215  ORF Transcript_40667/g.85215 Transcript_40667/m.85215 type:complete len:213 (+) Transcript_40667:391-1029(+)
MAVHDLLHFHPLKGNVVDRGEQGEVVRLVLASLQADHHVLGGNGALQLLPVQQSLLNLIPRLAMLTSHERLGALAVAAAVAGGDEIGDATALEEGVALDGWEVEGAELLHLHEADAHDGRLGVAAQLKAVAEASAERHHVLERTAQLDARHVRDHVDLEGGAVEALVPQVGAVHVEAADGRLAKLVLRNLIRNVGAHQDRTRLAAHRLADHG